MFISFSCLILSCLNSFYLSSFAVVVAFCQSRTWLKCFFAKNILIRLALLIVTCSVLSNYDNYMKAISIIAFY